MLNKDVVNLQEAYKQVHAEGYVPDNDAGPAVFAAGALIAFLANNVWPSIKEFCKPEEAKYVERALKSEHVVQAAKKFVQYPDVTNKQNLVDALRTMTGLHSDPLDGVIEKQHKQDLIFKIVNKLRYADL